MTCFLVMAGAEAQIQTGNLRTRQYIIAKDTLQLDSLNILRESLVLRSNGEVLRNGYKLIDGSRMVFDSIYKGKSIEISYRVTEQLPNKSYFHKSKLLIEPTFSNTPKFMYNYANDQGGAGRLFGENINASGNIARGIGFGNNQDLVINSNMNFQLSGKVGKGISLLAAVSDVNNPIQPSGNTQQIQDFDQVYITFFKDSSSLTGGDFLMNTDKNNYFMKYYKKSRGLQLNWYENKKVKHLLHADMAVSRGKFVRNEFQGSEGNQGPYRLQGANGELNIIVISATESVYIDGQKMERGQQNDYVIDYNTGEITFMPSRLITQFNRIVVEFQYSDRNYNRSVVTVSETISRNKWLARVHYFSEQDNKTQPTDTSSKDIIRELLEASGDQQVVFNNIKKYKGYQAGRVNYLKRDSSGYEIYAYASEPGADTAYYLLTFSMVGQGNGNYVQIASSANGRVFAWVKPLNGIPQGNYEPITVPVAPKRLQMLTGSVAWRKNENVQFRFEGAYTNNNINTYSSLDKSNDDGLGLFGDMVLKKQKLGKLIVNSNAKVEYVSKNFTYVERYRSVEFNRIWNRQLSNNVISSVPASELIGNIGTQLEIGHFQKLGAEYQHYQRGNVFNGNRGLLNYGLAFKDLLFNVSAEKLKSGSKVNGIGASNDVTVFKTDFQDGIGNALYGVGLTYEESQFSTDTSQVLSNTSFRYYQTNLFLKSKLKKNWSYRLDGNLRNDYKVSGLGFAEYSKGYNASGGLEHSGKKSNRLNLTASYRNLQQKGSVNNEEVILGRMEYNASFLKRVIIASTYYQIGTGREQKRTFTYTLVQSGFGNYTWVDYNKNGIEEINEFEPAIYSDQAKYVKVYLPTNEFIKSNSNEFNQSLRVQAPADWQGDKPWKRFLFRFNSVTAYKADRKITDNSLKTIVNPFGLNVADSSLIAVNSLIKQTTFFNRANAKFGVEHTVQNSRGKQFLYTGFETKLNTRNQMIARYGFFNRFNLVLELERQNKQNLNQFFFNRNYDYNSDKLFPELFYQTRKGFRLGLYYKYTQAFNSEKWGGEQAYLSEYGTECRYFVLNKGNIDAKFSLHDISFTGNSSSPLAYDLLSGLSNGRNMTWSLSFGGRAAGYVQINLSYEGRRTTLFKTVHIGKAEARIIF